LRHAYVGTYANNTLKGIATMNKTKEQWDKVDARLCSRMNSAAANMYLFQDAKQDIAELHATVDRLTRALERIFDRAMIFVEDGADMSVYSTEVIARIAANALNVCLDDTEEKE